MGKKTDEQRPRRGLVSAESAEAVASLVDIYQNIENQARRLRETYDELTQPPVVVEVLTYTVVVEYLVGNRPVGRQSAERAVAIRQKEWGGWVVHLCYLDARGSVVVDGLAKPLQTYHATKFDDELDRLFNGNDLIIFG